MNSVILHAKNLSIAYKNEVIIKNASFDAKEGEFIFITGKSGSGKTTIIKSLFGEIDFNGELFVNYKNLKNINPISLLKLRRSIGIVFQDYKLISDLKVFENIALPLKIAGLSNAKVTKHTNMLLDYIKLSHKAKKYPYELSGGEQQRIAVARAIIHNPKLIICDEPTGNLDIHSADIIWQMLEGAKKSFNSCVLVTTHHIPNAINFAYRHFNIENGVLNEFF
ncbi:cell division ATP-binding protein FtsE [Campylobacter canadensis]|uniref:ATP-binding cassette domain-containing protein n=1 Tax=Campylobacter canadensis TaxID=449520 RepID=A0ABS7WPN8_9BACT|nr:ATP-binding cassette domain-containing protein [Campylobacter canadensis]MBZ7986723.1 ATP-binding cassette domain-containing protein [Campylobacter canadensis]MBZ7994588.1 ATP-binding cassette domain-containing protein [Campylobacter canadensis]MBZ7996852.1 ATP-binding cassette domain-containing protein [Campylobacter canadensis]MBZ7997759.1 ATP-binding cassette domain-containing protein [Campylobacter canadensis]MBZ7999919.1 ATP-binding cassette domain-containing protein [Campylobacter can